MSAYSNTTLANTIDIKWDMELEQARYANAVIMPRILNKSDKVKKSGNQVSINVKQKLSSGTVASGGGFTPATTTPQIFNVTVDTWKYVAEETDDQAKAQSFWSPESDFPKDAGATLAEVYDQAIAALYTDLTSNVVGDANAPDAFDDVAARIAMLKLADRNIPKDSLSFLLPPIAYYMGWLAKTELTAAQSIGLPKNVLTTNFRTPILGVPGYETTLLSTSGTAIKAMLLHKSVFAIAFQYEHDFKRAERTAALVFSAVAATQSLYGVKTIRQDHGVLINVRNS